MATSIERAALRKAAEIIANEAKRISAAFSKRIPASIRIIVRQTMATVTAGGESAPAAGMFETPRARHPLFGDKEHWYYQPYRPFLEEAAEVKGDEAMQAFADEVIRALSAQYGYK